MDDNQTVERVLESRIQLRNDTAANWAAVNPVLLKGEIGIEIDTRKIKIGENFAGLEKMITVCLCCKTEHTVIFLRRFNTRLCKSAMNEKGGKNGNKKNSCQD